MSLRTTFPRGYPTALQPNPFSTRFVSPGKLDWVHLSNPRPESLASRFLKLGGCAAIVGPHGTGKTTLLHHLVPWLGTVRTYQTARGHAREVSPEFDWRLDEQGRIVWLQLRRDCQPWRQVTQSQRFWSPGGCLLLDGFEQLSLIGQCRVLIRTKLEHQQLLITTHKRCRLIPTLYQTEMSEELAAAIVKQVLERSDAPESVASQLDLARVVTRSLRQHDRNFRETLMDLYDRWGHLCEAPGSA